MHASDDLVALESGRHEHTLEEYGLDRAAVEKRFADYLQRFDVRCEA